MVIVVGNLSNHVKSFRITQLSTGLVNACSAKLFNLCDLRFPMKQIINHSTHLLLLAEYHCKLKYMLTCNNKYTVNLHTSPVVKLKKWKVIVTKVHSLQMEIILRKSGDNCFLVCRVFFPTCLQS